MHLLDCRQQSCPMPVVETRKALLTHPGEPLKVLVGDDTAKENVCRMAAKEGYQSESSTIEGGYELRLSATSPAEASSGPLGDEGKTVVLLGSDQMGQGDPELGQVLMNNYLLTLTQISPLPDNLFFVNAGVKLTTTGAASLEALNQLACAGVDIASCGLCLEFFHLKDKLAVGRVTNMVDIAESMLHAARVIRP